MSARLESWNTITNPEPTELRAVGALAEILGMPLSELERPRPGSTRPTAYPSDAADVRLVFDVLGGVWRGDLGELGSVSFRNTLPTTNLAIGVQSSVQGVPSRWNGTAWQSDLIVGPFTDIPAANAWAAANPSSLFPGLLATAGGSAVVWRGGAWVNAAAISIASELVAAYESEVMRSEMQGYRNEARAGLPVAADTPTISSSATAPASDTDVAAQEIKVFGVDSGDPLTAAQKAVGRKWLRGWNPNLRARIAGDAARLSVTIHQVGNNGNQDQDALIEPGTSWGISLGNVIADMWLDSDVLFFWCYGGTAASFELFVNGNLCTNATIGANISQDGSGRMYYQTTTGYTKIKFTSSARRRITMVFPLAFTPQSLHTRLTSSLIPVRTPKVWIHSGDSFSQHTISDTNSALNIPTLGLTHWMHSMFGFGYDFINLAVGGTSLCGVNQVLPSTAQPYTNGLQASNRKVLRTVSAGLNASIFTCLFGHNDANYADDPMFESEFRAFVVDVRSMHPNALLVIFGSDASPSLISGGQAVAVENKMISLCSQLGVIFVPLQTGTPPVLTGSGNQGSTNGTGNSDFYTGPDGTHPTAKGHRDAYGLTLARRLYEVLKAL